MAAIITYGAALSAIIAVLLGLARASGAEIPAILVEYFEWHRLLGLISAGITVATAVSALAWQRSGTRRAQIVFRTLLAINVIVMSLTGHLGGALVYGPDYYTL